MQSLSSKHATQQKIGIAAAVTSATFFSAKSILIKLGYRYGVDAITLLMLRMLFSLPFFGWLAWWTSRKKPPLSQRDWLWILFLGFTGYYLSSVLDFSGLQYIGAGFGRMVMFLYPTFVLLLGRLLFGRRISRRQIGCTAICYLGVVLIFEQERAHAVNTHPSTPWLTGLGALLILASALFYALYLLVNGQVVKRIGALRLTGLAGTVACVLTFIHYGIVNGWLQVSALDPLLALSPNIWWIGLALAILSTVLPIGLMTIAIDKLGAASASQYTMFGPVITILLGAGLLGERITPTTALGVGLILLGMYWI